MQFPTLDHTPDAAYGGKANGLIELRHAGMPVPDGFIVPPDALARKDFLETLEESLAALGGELFAVRSSGIQEDAAQQSMAGTFRSALRITKTEVRSAMEGLITHTARIGQAPIAYVVQRYVAGSCSGVAFTRHPTRDYGKILVVDAVEGTAESAVSGTSTPVRAFAWNDGVTLTHQEFPNLPPEILRELAMRAFKMEEVRGMPLDLEWTFDGVRLWILQARPMTALPSTNIQEQVEEHTMWTFARRSGIALDRRLYAETFRGPCSPASLDVLRWMYRPDGGFARAASRLGLSYDAEAAQRFLVLAYGHVYTDTNAQPIQEPHGLFGKMKLAVRLPGMMHDVLKAWYQLPPMVLPQPTSFTEVLQSLPNDVEELYASLATLGRLVQAMQSSPAWSEGLWQQREAWLAARDTTYASQPFDLMRPTEVLPRPLFSTPQTYAEWIALAREDAKMELGTWLAALHAVMPGWSFPVQKIQPPETITWESLFDLQAPTHAEEKTLLQGIGVSGGVGEGVVWIGDDVAGDAQPPKNAILVVEAFTPEWFRALPNVKGILAEFGGALSHGAIQCREQKIPAIFGVNQITQRIKNGTRVMIDGKRGTIKILEE